MEPSRIDRRRGRRVSVEAPLTIRRQGERKATASQEKLTKNLSLAGVYFETDEKDAYTTDEIVMASVSIPGSRTREFPFTRLSGRSRVVRVDSLPESGQGGRTRFGVALEFGEDLTALTALPARG